MTPLRVVCYAVNGTGVGHVTRLLSIARWMRRYAASLDRKLEIWFLTSSEADGLVFQEGFAAFKIPSKTIVGETGIDRTAYLALAKQWIWHTLGLLRPDLLIVDTFPRGSFGELLGALDLCRHKAFIYRPVRPEVAARPDFQAMIPLYDLVVVPETKTEIDALHVGPIISRERWEMMPRDVARVALGVDRKSCVFVSAGGGGERHAEARIAETVAALEADPEISVAVGTGPLYRGRAFPRATIVPGSAAEHGLAFDAAVCAAGYNTWNELMYAGVPTAFLPQEKLADDQRARADRAVAAGAAITLEATSDVREAVRDLLAREDAPAAARALVPENGARLAAAELLRLIYPASAIDRVEDELDDTLLAALPRKTELAVLDLARRLARDTPDLSEAVEAAKRWSHHDLRELRGILDAITKALPTASVEARTKLADTTLSALEPLLAGDGAAARHAVASTRWPNADTTLAAAIRAEAT